MDLDIQTKVDGVLNARRAAAKALVHALRELGSSFSERALSERWQQLIAQNTTVLPQGWYQPPPGGVSVLAASPPNYERLAFESLRSEQNWPRDDFVFSQQSILYPYFSTVDQSTLMIGDHVGTYYSGPDETVKDWIRACYACTRRIAENTEIGMSFSDVFSMGNDEIKSCGARNNNFSVSGGLAKDIGHTIPFFADARADAVASSEYAVCISKAREFVSCENSTIISPPCGFTVEPQILSNDHPMVGFHFIVLFTDKAKFLVSEYDQIFHHFGMDAWINR